MNPTPKRRWFRFTLRTLLALVTILCVALGLWVERARRLDIAVDHFRRLGGDFGYLSQLLPNGRASGDISIRGPVWVRNLLGDHLFDSPAVLEFSNKRPLKDADLVPLAQLTTLRSLCLNGAENEISDEGWAALRGLVHLRWLMVGACKPMPTDAMLSHVAQLPELEVLQIRPSNFTADGMAHLKGLTMLRNLGVGSVKNLDAAMEHLQALQNLEAMSSVAFASRDEAVSDVDTPGPGQFPSLKLLQLTGKLTRTGYEHLLRMPKLEDLSLFWEQAPDEAMPIVARVPKLRKLHCRSKRVTDIGLAALGDAAGLETLSLELEQVDGSGLRSLVRLAKLENLYFQATPIVDESLSYIGQMPTLKWVTLEGSKVTPAAVQELRTKRPGLKILCR